MKNKKGATSTNSPKNLLNNFKKEYNFLVNHQEKLLNGQKNEKSVSSAKKRIEDEKSKPSPFKLDFKNLKKKEEKKEMCTTVDNILNTSNSSIKSSMRESNYYKNEFEKVSNYIKKCKFVTNKIIQSQVITLQRTLSSISMEE